MLVYFKALRNLTVYILLVADDIGGMLAAKILRRCTTPQKERTVYLPDLPFSFSVWGVLSPRPTGLLFKRRLPHSYFYWPSLVFRLCTALLLPLASVPLPSRVTEKRALRLPFLNKQILVGVSRPLTPDVFQKHKTRFYINLLFDT